jgi:GT2 family glycosyltransferase
MAAIMFDSNGRLLSPMEALEKKKGPQVKWAPLKDKSILSEVDIIVPYYGQYEHVAKLVQSLWESTRGIFYNLYLIDDGSPNIDFGDKLSGMNVPSLKVIRSAERRGMGASLNLGLQMSKSPWVVFCNSDVVFDDGSWLKKLGECYRDHKDKDVKMVSVRMDNCPPGHPSLQGKKGDLDPDTVIDPRHLRDIPTQDLYVPFVCTLAHRELFNKIGMIKEYPLGWYEDVEFACRMKTHGFRQAISGNTIVHHEGGATVKAICESEKKTKKVFESNYELCCLDIKALQKSEVIA